MKSVEHDKSKEVKTELKVNLEFLCLKCGHKQTQQAITDSELSATILELKGNLSDAYRENQILNTKLHKLNWMLSDLEERNGETLGKNQKLRKQLEFFKDSTFLKAELENLKNIKRASNEIVERWNKLVKIN